MQSMRILNKDGYTEWKDKLGNKLNNVRPGYGQLLKFIEKNSGSPIDHKELQDEIDLTPHEVGALALKEELWSVLMDKTEGVPGNLCLRCYA